MRVPRWIGLFEAIFVKVVVGGHVLERGNGLVHFVGAGVVEWTHLNAVTANGWLGRLFRGRTLGAQVQQAASDRRRRSQTQSSIAYELAAGQIQTLRCDLAAGWFLR